MALKLVATYSKRLGLPGYSSHQFCVCVETEINNVNDIDAETTRLYETLQNSVDREIQHVGFVPAEHYGQGKTNGRNGSNGNGSSVENGNGDRPPGSSFLGRWMCSDRQQDLILKLIDDNQLDKKETEAYSVEHFQGKGVKQLDKTEASELIEYLIGLTGPQPSRGRRPAVRP